MPQISPGHVAKSPLQGHFKSLSSFPHPLPGSHSQEPIHPHPPALISSSLMSLSLVSGEDGLSDFHPPPPGD